MEIEPVPIIRSAYLNLFMGVLNESGINLETGLQQFNLPTSLTESPEGYVPMMAVLSFLNWAGASAGIEDVGARAASRMRILDFDDELRSALLDTSNLEDALKIFCSFADREQSGVRYTMVCEQDTVRIWCSHESHAGSSVNPCGEWLQIMPLLAVIRYFAGDSWAPRQISCQAQHMSGTSATRIFSGTRILTGQQETGITFPASLFCLATTRALRCEGPDSTPGNTPAALSRMNWDYPTSLRALLLTYLDGGYPPIELAAEISGTSVRTLQRRLKQFGLSYTDVVLQARLEMAKGLLQDPCVKIIDTALAVGYDDPSHFSRAFKRMAGVTPRQYRSFCYAQ